MDSAQRDEAVPPGDDASAAGRGADERPASLPAASPANEAGAGATAVAAAVPESRAWLPAFRVAGIDVRIHVLAVPVQAVIAFGLYDASPRESFFRFGVLLLLLFVVLLHELSHAFVARAIGLRVFDVRVHPIGGVARFERRLPPLWTPREEWLVALAGPAGNLACAALGFAVAAALGRPIHLEMTQWLRDPLSAFTAGSLSLGVLNLVPAFPSDGGRILRAVLARRLSFFAATVVAVVVGAVVVLAAAWAIVSHSGERALVGLLPIIALLAVYGAAEWRFAVLRSKYDPLLRARIEAFQAFVASQPHRFPALLAPPTPGVAPDFSPGSPLGIELADARQAFEALGKASDSSASSPPGTSSDAGPRPSEPS